MTHPRMARVRLGERAKHFERIGAEATRRAQQENRRRGVPNVYSRQGRLWIENPFSGRLLEWDPVLGRACGAEQSR